MFLSKTNWVAEDINKAGLIDNDWPLMDGQVVPSDYAGTSLWATLAHSASAAPSRK